MANPATKSNQEGAHLPSSSFFGPKNGGGLRGVSIDLGKVGVLDPPSPTCRSAPANKRVNFVSNRVHRVLRESILSRANLVCS